MQLALVIAALIAIVILAWTIAVRSELLTASQFVDPRSKPSSSLGVTLTPAASELHRQLRVADLHCDVLMWNRDLTRRSRYGQFDFPRMMEGNAALELFLSVTEMPRQSLGDNLTDKSDRITLLGVVEQWPLGAIVDQNKRALYFAEKLKRHCSRTGGSVRLVETAAQLDRALADRTTDPKVRGIVLGLESSDGTKYALANIERLFAAGYRSSQLCHFTDTPFAASASGLSKGGLTPLGREAVALMNKLGMIVDLAHASPRTIEDVLSLSRRPAFISHTGARSVSNDPKCQSDELLRAVVEKGGVVGLCFVEDYIGGTKVADISRSLEYLVKAVGQDGIVLGSGFDSLPGPIAVDQLPYLTQALLSAGLDRPAIKAVMGENAIRFLLRDLPKDQAVRA